jgi:DNA-binding MarR family transcriptional regulator
MLSSDPFVASLQAWLGIFMRRSMRNFMLYAKDSGLSISQIMALFRIQKGADCVSDLGDALGVTSAAASQMLERLVQQELILRSEDPHDRRAKKIALTEKGRGILQESLHARQNWLDELAETLSPTEKETVMAALDILNEKANLLQEQNQ